MCYCLVSFKKPSSRMVSYNNISLEVTHTMLNLAYKYCREMTYINIASVPKLNDRQLMFIEC